MHLADAQGQLAVEQQGRAEDADALAVMLERVANSERAAEEAANLRVELEREREFVEELRVSVREKYEDCNTLRQRLADAEALAVAKELEDAAERHALTDRADLFARQLDEAQKQLELARATEEAARTELARLSTELEDSRRERGSVEAELEKANAALKNANMKTFAANKQLESWKGESQRAMDESRREHQAALEALAGEVVQGNATALALRRQLEGAREKLEALTVSLGAVDQQEREIDGLRELTQGTRRMLLEHADHARKALAEGEEVRPTPAAAAFAAATIVPSSLAPPTSTQKRPLGPPPRPAPLTKPTASSARIAEAEEAETPALEIGVTEMRMEDLVEELREAQSRKP
jgi:chromosome segregation ATPase